MQEEKSVIFFLNANILQNKQNKKIYRDLLNNIYLDKQLNKAALEIHKTNTLKNYKLITFSKLSQR
jgi:hypothetical protein